MTSKLPPITIGIPFYNAEATLLDAVRSVFAQTHVDWELILLDDGSTDRSLELARSIVDPRVRVYSDGKNRQLAARLNEIVELASHGFIGRMDADDLMDKDRIRRELEILVENESCDLVSTGVLSLSDDNIPVGMRCVKSWHEVTPSNLLTTHHGILHASIISRKDWCKRNLYKEHLPCAEDFDLWVEAYSNDDLRVKFISEPLYFYREDSSASARKLLKAYKFNRVIIMRSSKLKFSASVRMFAYARSFAQTLTVSMLSFVGNIEYIRRRRNRLSISDTDRIVFENKIKEIRLVELPIKSVGI